MEPVSLLIAALATTAAAVAGRVIRTFFRDRSSPTLNIKMPDGKEITIGASELTREKLNEIVKTRPAAAS